MKKWILPVIAIVLFGAVLTLWKRPAQGDAEPTPLPAESTGRVAFRMEQQWLIRMKMALAEEAKLPPQIYSTGRVVVVPSNRALVAPPVGGIIDSRPLPRIGQQVMRGQLIATLVQTPTAAEAAQIRIENSRVDAERRRLGQAEIEARARLSAAAAEAGRASRLLEQKAYSQRQFETAEADRKAAEATLAGVQEQAQALQTASPTANYEVTAVFEVDNGSGDLKIGMQANLRLGAGVKASVLLVPKESVLDNEGKKIVYVMLSGEEFERRDVVVGDEYGDKVAVVSGVKPGERVVTQGAYQLKLQELRPANAGAHTHEV